MALPDDGQRYELLEGALVVNPPPSGRHQLVSWELTRQLKATCPQDLHVVEALGVRLPENTVLIPDVLVAFRDAVLAEGSGVVDASCVVLVAEIVSPGSRTTDRVTKPSLYAAAGIPSYWRVEMDDGPRVHLYQMHEGGGRYREVGSFGPGEILVADRPFSISVEPVTLRP